MRTFLKISMVFFLIAYTLDVRCQRQPSATSKGSVQTIKNKTYLGFELSLANDIYEINDEGTYLKSVPLYNVTWGFNVCQELNRYFFIETGFIFKYYQEGFGFKTIPYYSSSSSDPSWIIPIRIGMDVNIYKYKLFMVPVIGYAYGINPPVANSSGFGRQESGNSMIDYSYSQNGGVSRYFSLLQLGFGMKSKIFKTLQADLSFNYYLGYNTITNYEIIYQVNIGAPINGSAIGKGDFWCISLGLKYPLSNFWHQ